MAPKQTREQDAESARLAKTSSAEGNSLRELSKVPGVLEEGIISFHYRPRNYGTLPEPKHLCHTYLLMLPASCRHPVRLLGTEDRGLPTQTVSMTQEPEYVWGSVREAASMVDGVVTELGPIQHPGFPHEHLISTGILGKGVYVLYDDGKNLRLLTRLYEQDVSDYPKDDQEKYGVYTTGDSVIKVDHDNTALWNRNFLQRVGYISYSSRPDQEPALLDCKGTAFILYGRKPDLEHPSSKIPQSLTQLLHKAAKESSSPPGFRSGIHDSSAMNEKLLVDSAGTPISPETLEEGTTKQWPTYRVKLDSGGFAMRKCAVNLLLAVCKSCMPEAAISEMEEETYTDGVSCLMSCRGEDDAKRYCEVLRSKGVSCTIDPL